METGTRSFGSWRSFPEPSRQSRGWREEGPRGVRSFIGIVIQLLLLVAVVHWLDLESGRGLTQPVDSSWLWFSPIQGGLVSLLAAGFLVHAFLPHRWRMPFFLGLILGEFSTACLWVFIDGHFGIEGNMIFNF